MTGFSWILLQAQFCTFPAQTAVSHIAFVSEELSPESLQRKQDVTLCEEAKKLAKA